VTLPLGTTVPTMPAGGWRVATWNVWWRFGPEPLRRRPGIEATLRQVGADVICLQEVYRDRSGADDARDLGAELGYRVVGTGADPTAERTLGNAILSRWDIVDEGERPLPDTRGRHGHRRALWAVLAAPFGPLTVISTHLAYRFDESAVRQHQVAVLAELAAELRPDPARGAPVVLCWPQVRDDPGRTWVRRNPHLVDSVWPERRLDYVLVSWPRPAPLGNPTQAFLLGDGPVDGIWPSDHLGVAVDFRGAGGASGRAARRLS
jgi:endonuclease/exonuclease/phosphatase family metal-dependent hydrolase